MAAILAAKEALEAEAREKAAREVKTTAERKGVSPEEAERAGVQAAQTATVNPRALRNFTDPDARIMKTADGSFHYCLNAQAVVDEHAQVIIATTLVQDATDVRQLIPMIEATTEQLTRAGVTESPLVLTGEERITRVGHRSFYPALVARLYRARWVDETAVVRGELHKGAVDEWVVEIGLDDAGL